MPTIKKGDIVKVQDYLGYTEPNILKVRITNMYSDDNDKLIVEYRYNWPFPITSQQYWSEFKKRIVREKETK